MTRRRCAQGHEWDLAAEEASADLSPRCPVCAQVALEVREPTVIEAGPTAGVATCAETSEPPAAGSPLPNLPGYEIQSELGRGGMGVVYKARHMTLNRLVAVKMMHGGAGAGPQERARFRVEVEAVACLQHPHIVQIYEVGEQAGMAFCSLEFVDGGTLSRKLTAGPLAPFEAARLVETLARAVHHAHERGIVHRDLKPGNILLMGDGTPKITDFGLAKRLEGQGITESGYSILGTPSYMAPEQADDKKRKIGPPADVYALGANLYEMVTGRPPFQAESPLQIVLKVLADEPVPPTHWRPDLPRDLEIICLKCLHKEPSERYASALALADDLRSFQNGEPIQARRPTAWERTRRWVKRHREQIAFAVGGLALVLLLAVLLWRGGRDGETEPTPPGDKENHAQTDKPKSEKPGEKPAIKPIDLPLDLALVPQDAYHFITVKLADLFQREGLLQLEKELEKTWMKAAVAAPFKLFESQFGCTPRSMARLTEVVMEQAKQSGAPRPQTIADELLGSISRPNIRIYTTTVPYDQAKLRTNFSKPPLEKTHRGKKYLVGPSNILAGQDACLCFVTDNIFVVTDSEARLKAVLDQHAAGRESGPLQSSLVQAKELPAVAAFRYPVKLREKWAAEIGDDQLLPLLKADTAVLAMDFVLRRAVGDAIKADFSLVFPDEATAQAGRKATAALKEKLQKMLSEARANLSKQMPQPQPKKQIYPFVYLNEFLVLGTKFADECDIALATADIKMEGSRLTAHLSIRLDIAAWIAAIQQSGERNNLGNQFFTIGAAFLKYHEKNGHLPPAAILSPEGKPLLSWRVALLPYLGQQKLYDQFKLDEAWDSPHNSKLLDRMPFYYHDLRGDMQAILQAKAAKTTYCQVVVGPGTAFEGKHGLSLKSDFPAGAANVLLAVEAATPVPWTKPEDVVYDPANPVTPTLGADPKQGFHVVFADGTSAYYNRADITAAELRALMTRTGKEKK